jgi:hypothetical protein
MHDVLKIGPESLGQSEAGSMTRGGDSAYGQQDVIWISMWAFVCCIGSGELVEYVSRALWNLALGKREREQGTLNQTTNCYDERVYVKALTRYTE